MRTVTDSFNFYQGIDPRELVKTFGSPLYLYNERIFRQRCKEMLSLSSYKNFIVNFAIKANPNLTLIKIAREEGCHADVSSIGEAVAAQAAGYESQEIFFLVNNVSEEELGFAVKNNIPVSVDSLSQLERYGKINPNGKIAIRFNSGIGGGHHEKVVTGGDGTKFGIMPQYIPQVKELLAKYNLKLIGINHHIGSQNWGDLYLQGVDALLQLARNFEDLEFIDFGGGFAIPYHKQTGEKSLDLKAVGESLDKYINEFVKNYGRDITFMIEPGRYLTAECGVLLGTVHSVKTNGNTHYAGTDLGFSVLKRPTLYDSHHDIEIYREDGVPCSNTTQKINIVGNQCESGDYIARERELPTLIEGDILGVLDAGAYGHSMSCTYNHRLRPAEVLIQADNSLKLIRRRDTFEDLLRNCIEIM